MTSRSTLVSGAVAPFELKGSLFTLTVMLLRYADYPAIEQALVDKVRQAPGFFNNTPLVIDLELLPSYQCPDFRALLELLHRYGLVPVGVRNGTQAQQQAALSSGLPLLPEGRPSTRREEHTSRSRLFNHPVRSGQQVYAPDGDLILLSTVSAGAEVMADGNIHVYGALRGRALAGIKGDSSARIFCQSLEAELISIAGHYRVIEELDSKMRGRAVQIYLSQDEHLLIEPLHR